MTKDARVIFRIDSDLKESANELPHVSLSEDSRRGVRAAVYGEPIVQAEAINEVAREQWEETESAFESVQETLRDIASESGAVALETAIETIEDAKAERDAAISAAISERTERAEAEVEEREADPETVSLDADRTAVEAAQSLLHDGEMPRELLSEGATHRYVSFWADECGMEPEAFFEYVVEELADEPVDVRHGSMTVRAYMTKYQPDNEPDARAATDGGTPR